MAVDVEYRYKDPHELVQRFLRGAAIEYLAQSQKPGILAIDLAGMDTALHQHHRQFAREGCIGTEGATARDDQGLHRPSFRGLAEFGAAHGIGILRGKCGAQADHFVIVAGALEAGLFGDGCERVGCGDGAGQDQQGKQGGKYDMHH